MFHVSHHLFQPKFLYVFFVSFDGLFDVLSIFFFFLGGRGYSIWYYYSNFRSPIKYHNYHNLIMIFLPFSEEIYLSLGFFMALICNCFWIYEVLRTFIFLWVTLLPITLPVAFTIVWIALFEAVLNAFVADYLAWSRGFWLYFWLTFLPIFLLIF